MGNKVFELELNDTQQAKFDEWCGHIKALRGEVGLLTWKITPIGIGPCIKVYSEDLKSFVVYIIKLTHHKESTSK